MRHHHQRDLVGELRQERCGLVLHRLVGQHLRVHQHRVQLCVALEVVRVQVSQAVQAHHMHPPRLQLLHQWLPRRRRRQVARPVRATDVLRGFVHVAGVAVDEGRGARGGTVHLLRARRAGHLPRVHSGGGEKHQHGGVGKQRHLALHHLGLALCHLWHLLQPHRARDARAHAQLALHVEGAVHALPQQLAQAQPQPGPCGGGAVGLPEGLEDVVQVLRGHAPACVRHTQLQHRRAARCLRAIGHLHNHLPARGVLDAVGHKVAKHLAQPRVAALQSAREVPVQAHQRETQPLLARLGRQNLHYLHQLVDHVKRHGREAALTGVHLGVLVHLVQNGKQLVCGVSDRAQRRVASQLAGLQQVGCGHHAGERVAQHAREALHDVVEVAGVGHGGARGVAPVQVGARGGGGQAVVGGDVVQGDEHHGAALLVHALTQRHVVHRRALAPLQPNRLTLLDHPAEEQRALLPQVDARAVDAAEIGVPENLLQSGVPVQMGKRLHCAAGGFHQQTVGAEQQQRHVGEHARRRLEALPGGGVGGGSAALGGGRLHHQLQLAQQRRAGAHGEVAQASGPGRVVWRAGRQLAPGIVVRLQSHLCARHVHRLLFAIQNHHVSGNPLQLQHLQALLHQSL
mmetsp:Transcript_31131/g.60088  ORF Transcript_31131/g.60088 Transcript_31131/m.60088 type:complete len:628 (+) Transcript_31131:1125-3008(+)